MTGRGRAATPAAALIAAGMVVVSGALAMPTAVAQTVADDEAAAGVVTVIAAPANNGVLRDDESLSVRITVQNDTASALTDAIARLHVDLDPVADQPGLGRWLTDPAPPAIPVLATVDLVAVQPGATAVATLTVDADELDLDETFGVRPIGVTVVGDDGTTVAHDRSAVVGQPPGTTVPGGGIVVIAPFTAPDARGRYLDADQLAELTGPGGRLTRTIDAAEGRAVVLGVDPRILASIRVLGAEAPESATALVERLAASRVETFALQYADADPLATVGTLDVAAPQPLGAGSAVISDEVETPPDLADLIAWEHPLEDWVWPADGTLGASAVDALRAEGARYVVAGADDLSAGEGLVRQLADDLTAVTADALATDIVRQALADGSSQARRAAVAELSAVLATTRATSVPLLALADRTASTGPALGQLLDEVTALPWARSGALGAATGLGAPRTDGALVDREPSAPSTLPELLELEAGDAAFARIAVDPSPLVADRRLDLLDALAIGGESADEAVERYAAESARIRAAVQVVESNTITLAGDRTSLPVTVQNGLPVEVRVFVRVEAATGALRVENSRVEAIVPAEAQVRALVPVQSLVNGDVDIRVSLRADDGEPVGSPIQLPLNLQAGWETAGTIAIGGVIAALFALGLARDIRRRRQQRASTPADAVGEDTATRPDETSTL